MPLAVAVSRQQPKPFLRNSEIDELCERSIYEYMGDDGTGKHVDIIGFTTGFLKLTILYANIAEEDMSKLGFLADGRTPLLVSCKGQNLLCVTCAVRTADS